MSKRSRVSESSSSDDDEVEAGDGYNALMRSLGLKSKAQRQEEEEEQQPVFDSEEEQEEEEEENEEQQGQEEEEEEEEGEGGDDNGEDGEDEAVAVAHDDAEEVAVAQLDEASEGSVEEAVNEDFEAEARDVDQNDPYFAVFCAQDCDEKDVKRMNKERALPQTHVGTVGTSGAKVLANHPIKLGADLHALHARPEYAQAFENLRPSELQVDVLNVLSTYSDLIVPNVFRDADRARMRDTYIVHILNHIRKSRERIWRNNTALRRREVDEARDQGFCRCRVLVLLPIRGEAYDFFRRLLILGGLDGKAEQWERVEQELASDPPSKMSKKPEDYRERFSVNTDDSFRFGVKFNYESIKFFSSFPSSDLIVASPLGLKTIIGEEPGPESDFLSSVEMVVLDGCEMLEMQNWDHVETVFRCLNTIPKEIGNTDFSRLQTHLMNGWGSYFRQTVMFGEVVTPTMNQLMRKYCFNPRKALVRYDYDGVLASIDGGGHYHHVFQQVAVKSVADAAEEKFQYFCRDVLPQLMQDRTGILIYIPSYFDYLRLRKHFKRLNKDFCHLCEYTPRKDVTRDRSDFFKKRAPVMLYTERLHFYHRLKIDGVEHVLFYGLPMLPRFYQEVANFVPGKLRAKARVTVLYTQYETLALERVVGTESAVTILSSNKTTHMFVV